MKTTILLVSISSLCVFCAAKPVEKAAEESAQAPAQDKSNQEPNNYFLQREEALQASLNAGGQKSDKHKRFVIDVRTMSHDSFPFMDEGSEEEHEEEQAQDQYSEGRIRRDSVSQDTPTEAPASTNSTSELDETLAKAAELSGAKEHQKPTPGISYTGRRRRDSKSQETPAPEAPATPNQPSELDETLAKAAELSGVKEHQKPTPGISYSGRRKRSVASQNVPVNPDLDEVFNAPMSMTGLDGEQSFRSGNAHFKRSADSKESEEEAESTESSTEDVTTTTTAKTASSDVKDTLARAFKLAGVTTHQKPDTDPAYGK